VVAPYVKLLENVLHFESGQCSAFRNGFCRNFSLSVLLSLSLTFSVNFFFFFFFCLLDQRGSVRRENLRQQYICCSVVGG
jgi:hypothetical protein